MIDSAVRFGMRGKEIRNSKHIPVAGAQDHSSTPEDPRSPSILSLGLRRSCFDQQSSFQLGTQGSSTGDQRPSHPLLKDLKFKFPADFLLQFLCLFFLLTFSFSPALATEPFLEKVDLFQAGTDGYKLYRIPGIVVSKKGTVLAYCEARKSDAGDWGPIDVLMRRSHDGGKTWGPPQTVVHVEGDLPINPVAAAQKLDKPGENTVNNPVAFVDYETGAIHFLYCLEYMRCFYIRSDDDGATWSEPVEITSTFDKFRPEYDWKVLATGPAHGIQLTHGPHKGRLVVPVWLSLGTGGHAHRPSVTSTIYSDDHGQTWQRGEIAVPDTPEFVYPNETVIVQLSDGRVMLNARSESQAHRRLITISPDGATQWTPPKFDDALLEPICMAGLARVREATTAQPGLIAFSNPHNLARKDGKEAAGKSRDRVNVTIKLSEDDGRTWCARRSLEPGFSGYSDLAALPDGTILCFYERGSTDGKNIYKTGLLTVARFNEAWVRGGNDADVCVYGGTSGGVIAAVQAARMGQRVLLLEPGRHLGGMTSGGLSAVDIGDPRTVGGLARDYFTRLVAKYGKQLAWDQPFRGEGGGPATGGAYSIEPHVAEAVFNEMIQEAGVTVKYGARVNSVEKDGPRITAVQTEDGRQFRARVFMDATYEGDLLPLAGVTYTLTREGNDRYGETLNGIQYPEKYRPRAQHLQPGPHGRVPGGQGVWDRDFPLDPYVIPGDPNSGLLPLLQAGEPGQVGEEAAGLQAYCFRLCLTTAADRLPIQPPVDYDPQRYELVARFIAACVQHGDDMDLRWFSKHDPLPNDKWDFNTATFGGNLPGASWEWPEASYARRAEIAREHENYHRGLLHFLATDPRVPVKVRQQMQQFGLPHDEFTDNGGWPHQIYVREARRMVSDLVMTQNHTFGKQTAPNSIGIGSYGTDIHEIRRIVKDGVVTREGKIAEGRGGAAPYSIGYAAIVPKQTECDNLFVTFALSASHVAFASLRMEPVFMMTSQSAATAAAIAINDDVPVQQVDYPKLRERLLKDGQLLAAASPQTAAKSAAQPLPTVDLSGETQRQVVIAEGTPEIYQGHPTTLLMPDHKTMFCVWTKNHGGPCGPMKRSDDGGKTWSKLLDTPENWTTVRNCPAIFRLTDPQGTTRLCVYAGQGPDGTMHVAHSADDGQTWSDMRSLGLKCIMPFCTIVPVDSGRKLIGLTNIRRPGETQQPKSNIIAQSESTDGGLTWSDWRIILDMGELMPCEPWLVRSPDGKQLLCLLRENSRKINGLLMTSDDEGRTWSAARPLPVGLQGDRHIARYAADGRLVICFRDTGKTSPTKNHFVAWVGTYDDIVHGRDGQYRIKLLHSHAGGDCGYPGLELLPDGTFVATTYVKYRPGIAKHSVVSTRFTLAETDARSRQSTASESAAARPEI